MTAPGVAYVVSQWGAPTQTFVRREAEAVSALEVDVTALSLKRPGPAGSCVPVTHLSMPAVFAHGLAAIASRPARAGRILGQVVRGCRPRLLPAQLWATVVGLAWAHAGLLRGRRAHAHFGWVAATAAWAAASWEGTTHSVVLHAFELHTVGLQDTFTRVPLSTAVPCYVISETDRALVRRRWDVEAEVLHMGVPSAWLELAEPAVVDPHLLVTVGSLIEKKGHDLLLQALAQGPAAWRLEIVGAGPLEAELLARRDELGLSGRVVLVGPVGEDEVRRRLRRAGASVLAAVEARSGDRDGVPVALMEAMALGVPVVSTRVGGIPELVEGAGILIEPGDVRALADALERLLDPCERARLGELGRARVAAAWTVEGSAAQVARAGRTPVG